MCISMEDRMENVTCLALCKDFPFFFLSLPISLHKWFHPVVIILQLVRLLLF